MRPFQLLILNLGKKFTYTRTPKELNVFQNMRGKQRWTDGNEQSYLGITRAELFDQPLIVSRLLAHQFEGDFSLAVTDRRKVGTVLEQASTHHGIALLGCPVEGGFPITVLDERIRFSS